MAEVDTQYGEQQLELCRGTMATFKQERQQRERRELR
jgi:hypothetical protein